MRRLLCILLILCFLPAVGCTDGVTADDGKLHVVATTFPAYDFARAVVGDTGTVTMLISPGTETHSYDPSPQDIRKIQNCDLFIYGGGESDAWMDGILASVDADIPTLAMTEIVSLLESPHIENPDEEHRHEHAVYDEHVWTSPANAAVIVAAVRDMLVEIDAENADLYRAQAEAYCKEIEALDAAFADLVQNAPRKTVLFADRIWSKVRISPLYSTRNSPTSGWPMPSVRTPVQSSCCFTPVTTYPKRISLPGKPTCP